MSKLNNIHIRRISVTLKLPVRSIKNTLRLLDDGASIPFISRYRKEQTGNLNEVQVEAIMQQAKAFRDLEERRKSILKNIEKAGKLSPELRKKIEQASDMPELEDLYLPFKRKRKTRASKARENGLQALADMIKNQTDGKIRKQAERFLNKNIKTSEDALQGARDIIAEEINENAEIRNMVRNRFENEAVIRSKLIKSKKEQAGKYQDYFDFSENLKQIPSHRLLAVLRGESEGFLRIKIEPDNEEVIMSIEQRYVSKRNEAARQLEIAVGESYKRLIFPSIENEFKRLSKEVADTIAVKVFAENFRQLLLSPPLGEKRILAVDPGYNTGCKIACMDEYGELLHYDTIFPNHPQSDKLYAAQTITYLTEKFNIEAIAVGNGTASRETVEFLRTQVKYKRPLNVFVVSENGASVYSASAAGREEFPELDATVRGTVSIGRRLADPLAELVKIEPKSVGVGQYQHDVNQKALKEALIRETESCVNLVGVQLNTASRHLLAYVSGLNEKLARNIIEYRRKNGAFKSREELKKVKMLGAKTYLLAAGFLRIRNAENPLDNTAVHPESYPIVEKMAKDTGVSIRQLIKNAEVRKKIKPEQYTSEKFGLPTITDILKELDKPGRDPRPQIRAFEFAPHIKEMKDVEVGMILPGIVTNLTKFGAFVDVGIKEDGLVHISKIRKRFVSMPSEALSIHQYVKVRVIEKDEKRHRISLSMLDVRQDI